MDSLLLNFCQGTSAKGYLQPTSTALQLCRIAQ
jgi:hypothetical protein